MSNRTQISKLISDPFVRDAFERAERDGYSPALCADGHDAPDLRDGAAAERGAAELEVA